MIDIKNGTYNLIKNHPEFSCTEHGLKMLFYSLFQSVENGVALQKGHGRLIDANNLTTITDIKEDGSEFTYVSYNEIEDAPTIIEADKEDEFEINY